MVWLIVSPVTSADEMIVVPSISPRTISAVLPRLRVTLRIPSLTKIRLRSASAPSAPRRSASSATNVAASGPIGMPKNSFIAYLASTGDA